MFRQGDTRKAGRGDAWARRLATTKTRIFQRQWLAQ
jgi:hypothetical protein